LRILGSVNAVLLHELDHRYTSTCHTVWAHDWLCVGFGRYRCLVRIQFEGFDLVFLSWRRWRQEILRIYCRWAHLSFCRSIQPWLCNN
jgi:hypothetical protein